PGAATLRVNASVPAPRHSTLQQIRQGFRFILQQRLFLVLILLSYALSFFASSYMQLMPAFADMLAADETGFGYLLSIGGIGAVLGTVIAGTLQHSIHLGRVMILAALVFLIFLYVFAWVAWAGYTGSFAMALAAIFAAAVFYSIFMVTSTGVLQLEVPDELRGRVMGFHAITYNLMPLGALFSGAIASWSNPSAAIAVSTSIVALFVLWIWLKEAEVTTINGGQLAH
ncbi:MAG: MFS transporter, partial [Gammaproteobacteria bacterium]